MNMTKSLSVLGVAVALLTLSSCDWLHKNSGRETIFDRVVNIPKELVLDIPSLPPLCDEITDLKKDFVEIENGELYYEEEGQGIPLVLINGGPGGTHHGFHPHFSRAKDFAHIIYYDQRGTGKSSKDDTGKTYSIRQAVEDLESLRKALEIDKWAVLGWSDGGFIAQCYALTYPEHVIGLILVAASDGLKKVSVKRGRSKQFITKAEMEAINKIYAAENDGKINNIQCSYNKDLCGDWKRQSYYKPTKEEMIRAALYEWSPAPGFRTLICRDENKIGLDGKFDDFEIPTLIFEAKWDLTWDTDKVEFMRKNHPHAQVEIFEKSGHDIFADEPEKFFAMLKNFLEQSSKAQIVYKPGNRLSWPEPASDLACKLAIAEGLDDKETKTKRILECYEQAIKEDAKDPVIWNNLANYFIDSKKDYEKCLTAFQKLDECEKESDPASWQKSVHCYKAWQGHMLDLLGKRDEAIQYYQEAMKTCDGNDDMSYYMKIDRKWLEARLKEPFTWALMTHP